MEKIERNLTDITLGKINESGLLTELQVISNKFLIVSKSVNEVETLINIFVSVVLTSQETIDMDAVILAHDSDSYVINIENNVSSIVIKVSANYTSSNGDFVDFTTGLTNKTVNLPPNPSINDIVEVSKADNGVGELTIDGNGENINGFPTSVIKNQYTVLTFIFVGTEWRIK